MFIRLGLRVHSIVQLSGNMLVAALCLATARAQEPFADFPPPGTTGNADNVPFINGRDGGDFFSNLQIDIIRLTGLTNKGLQMH